MFVFRASRVCFVRLFGIFFSFLSGVDIVRRREEEEVDGFVGFKWIRSEEGVE